MNVEVLRFWGMVVGTALIAIALWIAALGPESAPAEATTRDSVQLAQAETASVSFLVRFRGTGPIARAQADASQGNHAQAQGRIEAQLARQNGLAGLCFERFTVGAAEIVLRTCDPVAANQRAALESRWLSRLRAMRAVAYADVNATASPQRAPG